MEFIFKVSQRRELIAQRKNIEMSDSIMQFFTDRTVSARMGKEMTLSITEFFRRFEIHFSPKRFVKIRHYGFLQNHGRTTRLNAIRKELQLQLLPPKVQVPVAVIMLVQYGHYINLCPKCKQGKLILIAIVYPVGLASNGVNPGRSVVKLSSAKTAIHEGVIPGNKGSP